MGLIEELDSLGVNTGEAVRRLMGKQALYEKMLRKLGNTVNDNNVMSYFEAGDTETALSSAHTLKGVMGNLSITPLYDGYTEIVRLLREGKPDEAKAVLEGILPIQEKIMKCIESNS